MKKLIGFITILLGATGCSVLFVDGAPQSAPSREAASNAPCTDSRILPLVDLGMAGAFTASSFKNQFADDVVVADDMTDPDDAVITDDPVDADPEAEAGFSLEDSQWQIANIGLAAIAAGAGVWGWMKVSDCNAWLSQAIGEQSRQLADEYEERQSILSEEPPLEVPIVRPEPEPEVRPAEIPLAIPDLVKPWKRDPPEDQGRTPLGERRPMSYYKEGTRLGDENWRAEPLSYLIIECTEYPPVIAIRIYNGEGGRPQFDSKDVHEGTPRGRVTAPEPDASSEIQPVYPVFPLRWQERSRYDLAILYSANLRRTIGYTEVRPQLRNGRELTVLMPTDIGLIYYRFDLEGFGLHERLCANRLSR